MTELVPAIIGKNFTEVKTKIAKVEGQVNWVQLDIMDGLFVPSYTWQTAEDLKEIGGKIKIEAHLMVEQPELVIPDWMAVADRIIFHLEATEATEEILSQFESLPIKVGIALKLETPVEKVIPYLDRVSVVQLMSIKEIGYHGHRFEESVLTKIRDLRTAWPGGTISVDGGITLTVAKLCLDAGADNLAVGSALWESPDLKEFIEDFNALTRRQS